MEFEIGEFVWSTKANEIVKVVEKKKIGTKISMVNAGSAMFIRLKKRITKGLSTMKHIPVITEVS